MELIEETPPYLPRLLTARGERVRVAFSDREGGVSDAPFHTLNLGLLVGDEEGAVWENRIRVAAAAGFEADDLALAKQVHGADVVEATRGGLAGDADVLVTDVGTSSSRPVLGILTADCAPVVLEGPARAGIVHAGWRGVVGGAVEAGLSAVGDVRRAWIGPSIHACCYEVGPEVIEAFAAKDLPIVDGARVDPARAATILLRRGGVEEIAVSDICTSCDGRYFSYRRDGLTGRQGAFVWPAD